MPDEESQTGEQKGAEDAVEGFQKTLGDLLSPPKQRGCRWCSPTQMGTTSRSFLSTVASSAQPQGVRITIDRAWAGAGVDAYEPAGVVCQIVMPIVEGGGWMRHE